MTDAEWGLVVLTAYFLGLLVGIVLGYVITRAARWYAGITTKDAT